MTFLVLSYFALLLSIPESEPETTAAARSNKEVGTGSAHFCGAPVVRDTGTSYLFVRNGSPVLEYQYKPAVIPATADKAFAKSGYIHPLFSPGGKVLSRVQPPDHLHHYGVWKAWARTLLNGQQVDFWNLGQKTGRVDYVRTISVKNKNKYASIQVLQHHVAIDADQEKTVAIVETLEIRVLNNTGNMNVVDYISKFYSKVPGGILLEEYRYGGFVFRGNEEWDPATVRVITSEGRTQDNSDGERARWCLVATKGESNHGILLLSHPGNFNHPEPLRTWNNEANNGKSNIFINFSPIRNMSWMLEKDRKYILRYRVITFDEQPDNEIIERMWNEFARQ